MLSAGIAANAAVSKRRNAASVVAVRERGLARRRDVGAEAPQRVEPDARAQHEHAAVPVVAAVGEVALGGGEVGLLDEGGDRAATSPASAAALGADVAVAGVGPLRPDAEDDDAARGGRAHRLRAAPP